MNSTISLLSLASAAMFFLWPGTCFAQAEPGGKSDPGPDAYKISGPFTHDQLSVYLIHGPSAGGPVPLTLNEALAKKLFKVFETGNVNELAFENTGDEPVFLQSGDIVKGGRQDRVLTTSVLVPGKSGRMPIAAYCVEQHRWSARGQESAALFESSARSMPSRKAKLAMMAQSAAPRSARTPGREYDTGKRQTEVWSSVAETQAKLSARLGAPVAAPQSASSLQLSLENEKLNATKAAYVTALSGPEKEAGDVVGLAFAVNGRINSADIYPSHGLFTKMWGKLIDAAATEAIGEAASGEKLPPPATDAVMAFLAAAASASPEELKLDANTQRVRRQNDASVLNDTKQNDGKVLHRSVVAF